ncbi:MAG: hypothetical protein IPH50_13200 [Rhodanobacteraceae bacterium]|nr:hypothetical protein [Rhodanobacteraceae bacterium]MBP9154297.1 hypothetical protein [Xanthomonadales bacterium]
MPLFIPLIRSRRPALEIERLILRVQQADDVERFADLLANAAAARPVDA